MEISTRIKIVQIYYQLNRSEIVTLREYKNRHSMKNNPFKLSGIRKKIPAFENIGSIHNMPRGSRPSLIS